MIDPAVSRFPLLPRKKKSDKNDYGHVLVLAGSRGLTGAAILASRAASLSGSGLVTVGIPKSLETAISKRLASEIMCLFLPETSSGSLSFTALKKIFLFIKKRRISCVAVGPGLSTHPMTTKLVREIVRQSSVAVVLDADGLNSFKGRTRLLKGRRCPLILTPHRHEFERLFGEEWPEAKTERIRLAKKLSKFYDVILVLKGHETVVALHDKIYINKTGNPGMAKGGSGDALTGIIASFLAQRLDAFQAAVWAVYFHGKAGDRAVKEKSELGATATDLIEALPKVFLKR